jgi:NADPH:quinone reductase-like Zn-dependent oxidoreductase
VLRISFHVGMTSAWTVDHEAPAHLRLQEVPEREPAPGEAVVELEATSLNRGESNGLAGAATGYVPGWDVVGRVVVPARDGSGPSGGARVVALLDAGGWVEKLPIATDRLAVVPNDVAPETAATLPIAALTALRALRLAGTLPGERVLVTGATGGVGVVAIQLARLLGARVDALVSRTESVEWVRALGAEHVHVGSLAEDERWDVVLESVGGDVLAAAVHALAPRGRVVSFGNSSGAPTSLDARDLFGRAPGSAVHGYLIFPDARRDPVGRDLGYLLELCGRGLLEPRIDGIFGWEELPRAVEALLARTIDGKVVVKR